jgi:hypothetical protein
VKLRERREGLDKEKETIDAEAVKLAAEQKGDK